MKADKISGLEKILKVGNHIKWSVYRGTSPVEAKAAEDYIQAFFKSGDLMPIRYADLGLDILGVSVEYDEAEKVTTLTIDGIVKKLKGAQP